MINKEIFSYRDSRGKLGGFANLFAMEMSRWWKSKDWIFQIILWTVVLNISLLGIMQDSTPEGFIGMFGLMFGMFPSIAVIIIMQDVIIGERETGTIQWILSKPCSRMSFITSKLLSNSIGVIVSMVIVPGFVGYLLIFIIKGNVIDVLSYIAGLGILSLLLLFYLTLTLMLGTINQQRGLAIGLPLLFNFGIITLFQNIKELFKYVPQGLFFPINTDTSLVTSIMLGKSVETYLPLILTTVYIVIFVIISLYKFNKEEF